MILKSFAGGVLIVTAMSAGASALEQVYISSITNSDTAKVFEAVTCSDAEFTKESIPPVLKIDLQRAEQLLRSQDGTAAYKILRQTEVRLQDSKNDIDGAVLLLIARAYFVQGQDINALHYAHRAAQMTRSRSSVYWKSLLVAGLAYVRLEQFQKAKEMFNMLEQKCKDQSQLTRLAKSLNSKIIEPKKDVIK
jgi:hypothetical protein